MEEYLQPKVFIMKDVGQNFFKASVHCTRKHGTETYYSRVLRHIKGEDGFIFQVDEYSIKHIKVN